MKIIVDRNDVVAIPKHIYWTTKSCEHVEFRITFLTEKDLLSYELEKLEDYILEKLREIE